MHFCFLFDKIILIDIGGGFRMGLFDKKIGPVFLKEDSDAEKFIAEMSELSEKASGDLKTEIDKQIKIAKVGLEGEKNIIFELKNSGIDMYILHDIYLEYGDKGAQIDFLIFTRKRQYVVECKNLIGNITINNDGSFIREYELSGKKIKEGIYSPITQNERHRLVIKELRINEKNILGKFLLNKNFDNAYVPIVVLANPKTVLQNRYAPKEVKEKVIRADQLIEYIKKMDQNCNDVDYSNKDMEEIARYFLSKNEMERSDYSLKYKEMLEKIKEEETEKPQNKENEEEKCETSVERICPRCGNKLVLRTAKKGEKTGQKFYGCSSFPHCKYIENI
ncbi:MAG: NERD domain-containing protein [Lachnospiraceae bacterium]|nr:NERD domain-containing protein [Lachnospiraceae bacterium]